jgi:hypothetical protein
MMPDWKLARAYFIKSETCYGGIIGRYDLIENPELLPRTFHKEKAHHG